MNKKERLLTGFRDVYNRMVWLNNAKMKDQFEGYQASEVHCIDYIGSHADANVTKMAEASFQTRAAPDEQSKREVRGKPVPRGRCLSLPSSCESLRFHPRGTRAPSAATG